MIILLLQKCILTNVIGFTNSLLPTSVIVGAESSTFSRRLSEAQKQQDEQDDDEGTIAFSKNWLSENKKPKYVLAYLFFSITWRGKHIIILLFGVQNPKGG